MYSWAVERRSWAGVRMGAGEESEVGEIGREEDIAGGRCAERSV